MSLQYPLDLTKTQIDDLKFGPELFKQGFFYLHEIKKNHPCDNCLEFHEVIKESDEYYYICNAERGGKERIKLDDIQVYHFKLEHFLQYLSSNLNIESNIHQLNNSYLWNIGKATHKGIDISIYFSHEAVSHTDKISQAEYYLILTSQTIDGLMKIVDDDKLIIDDKGFHKLLQMILQPPQNSTTEIKFHQINAKKLYIKASNMDQSLPTKSSTAWFKVFRAYVDNFYILSKRNILSTWNNAKKNKFRNTKRNRDNDRYIPIIHRQIKNGLKKCYPDLVDKIEFELINDGTHKNSYQMKVQLDNG